MSIQAPPREEVLALVNEMRALMGRGPLTVLPCGLRDSGDSCPLANALDSDDVGQRYIAFGQNDYHRLVGEGRFMPSQDYPMSIETPDLLSRFITAFDNLEYPELVEAEG